MKIGIDVLEINRIKTKTEFLNTFLNKSEIEYVSKFKNIEERVAGLFCAKEAVFKALCLDVFSPHYITISHDKNGRPIVILDGKYKEHFEKNYKEIDVSISHSKTIASAICIVN